MNCKIIGECKIPTKFSNNFPFYLLGFEINGVENEVLALTNKPYLEFANKIPTVRIHSACITSELFGSLKCDCAEQLNFSLEFISQTEYGIVIYLLNHEGRGIGINNKIKAYKLQEQGLDTIQANQDLGFEIDKRDFLPAVSILKLLKINKLRLITNNPEKVKILTSQKIKVIERIEQNIYPNCHNASYLETKINKMGHLIKQNIFLEAV